MQFGDIEVSVSSPPDREQLVVDLMLDHVQLAEVNIESGFLAVEIYPRLDGEPWRLVEADLRAALAAAAHLLSGR